MPGAGTDKTKRWVEQPGPVVILVEPQMGENIGSAARAMANFGLSRLRLVRPREEWPNPQARKMASGFGREPCRQAPVVERGLAAILALDMVGYSRLTDCGRLTPSADRGAGLPNLAAQPAMSRIGIQPRVPEQ